MLRFIEQKMLVVIASLRRSPIYSLHPIDADYRQSQIFARGGGDRGVAPMKRDLAET
jgi:hypothetical protein